MVLWFGALAGCRRAPGHRPSHAILRGLSPTYARHLRRRPPLHRVHRDGRGRAGHHRRRGALRRHGPLRARPIRRAWFALVFPALTLNYLGQGALILHRPSAIANPFFLLLPHWARIPMVVLATARDRHRLAGRHLRRVLRVPPGGAARVPAAPADPPDLRPGERPDLRARGQLAAVRRRARAHADLPVLGAAGHRLRRRRHRHVRDQHDSLPRRRPRVWHWPTWKLALAGAVFLSVEITFFAANLTKIVHGGWLPLLIAAHRLHGDDDLAARPRDRHRPPIELEGPLHDFIDDCTSNKVRGSGEQPSSRTRRAKPPRLRCARTSSTTTSSTRTS